ncbi:hypothetical protein CWC29_009995 [Pseudoalteromonas sp. S4498]|uniref:hypothetical protein n=1 Tax=Pseudoalteromonas galatheae TaxID=579562 RepID=UPI001109EBB9|nr:hypothetical protein [Pseudoalteromonas galatheae]NKC19169.1 hypothetical protein [Pseudoalteromonas galatheae]
MNQVSSFQSMSLLKINQANIYYNCAIGFNYLTLDLVKVAKSLLNSGISRSVFFSDYNCLYTNSEGTLEYEKIQLEGRHWDSTWKAKFSEKVPKSIVTDLMIACQISFHESKLQKYNSLYLRASLPPVVLEFDDHILPLHSSVKIFSDGIAILSFQLDCTWDQIEENEFINDYVNIFKRYCKSIWVSSELQRLDAQEVLKSAYENDFSVAGQSVRGFKVWKLKKKLKAKSLAKLNKSLDTQGEEFSIGGDDWSLHKVACTEDSDKWESTFELCQSMYINSLQSLLVKAGNKVRNNYYGYIWNGRPSITLLRFDGQPATKEELTDTFSRSLSKILMRTSTDVFQHELPPDLRVFDDYCFHANRALLLWTWLKPKKSSENVWDESDTASKIFENQARTEIIEHLNMEASRACSWAQSPINSNYLLSAYEILASFDTSIHYSSISGEVNDSHTYLMEAFGTKSLIEPSKEAAKFRLDELKYKSDMARNSNDRWLALTFGLVGAASLADFVLHPIVKNYWPLLNAIESPIVSIFLAFVILLTISIVVWGFNRR